MVGLELGPVDLVVDPSCPNYTPVTLSIVVSLSWLFRGKGCLTRKLLLHVLVVLVAEAIDSDEGSGLGITYNRSRLVYHTVSIG